MKITNRRRATRYKRIFFLVSIVIALISLALFLLDYTIFGLAGVGVFSIWYLFFHVADYQYLQFNDEHGRIVLRYYKAISFGSKSYHSIEFPHTILQNAHFEDSLFGKLSDLTFLVRTRNGIAEYPSVSLSALPLEDRQKMKDSLSKILRS
ncbi:hypothetical protein INQ51_03240 [Maribellus sp. CM-23]|uniref:hypothetical protein n=1 Tax=Maribellus sp. CM-23 TaxID=2781026 RepID=UPI001F410AD7|nr:hypothetical protein [Maribellus sp. CM-23]MCE4563315.1 hypothetical protein [Maribellus sp. CM-23]